MKAHIVNNTCNETVYASVRLNRREYESLYEYMHSTDNRIVFPYRVHLVKRGFGWYRLIAANDNRGVDKITFAVKVLNWFVKWQNDQLVAATRRYMMIALQDEASNQQPTKPVASVNKHIASANSLHTLARVINNKRFVTNREAA